MKRLRKFNESEKSKQIGDDIVEELKNIYMDFIDAGFKCKFESDSESWCVDASINPSRNDYDMFKYEMDLVDDSLDSFENQIKNISIRNKEQQVFAESITEAFLRTHQLCDKYHNPPYHGGLDFYTVNILESTVSFVVNFKFRPY